MKRNNLLHGLLAMLAMLCPVTPVWAQSLVNGGFESTQPGDYEFGVLNTRLGTWGADLGASVTAENGIVPRDGARMLKFIGTLFSGSSGASGDVVQLVPMGPGLIVQGSVFVNRVAMPGADPRMGILLRAHGGSFAGFAAGTAPVLGEAIGQLNTDADTATWQQVSARLTTPAGTGFLAVYLITWDDVGSGPGNFLGNYADSASIAVVPEPSSAWLLGVGALALSALGRRHHRKL